MKKFFLYLNFLFVNDCDLKTKIKKNIYLRMVSFFSILLVQIIQFILTNCRERIHGEKRRR